MTSEPRTIKGLQSKGCVWMLAAAALFSLPCARPTCCDRDTPCSGSATCLLTVDERVCSIGMCATKEEVADYLKENAP